MKWVRLKVKLKEMKVNTFSLIEEYYPELKNLAEDADVINKINSVVNNVSIASLVL